MSAVQPDALPPCMLCGSRRRSRRFVATRSGRLVVRCRGCGLLFYSPQPSAAEAAALYSAGYFAEEYPEDGAEEQLRMARARLQRIEDEVSRGRLLDVGCGRGRFLRAARERGWDAVGLDVAPSAAEQAAATSGATVLRGSLSNPRPAGIAEFDVLTLWDVLEHLTDPPGDLRRAQDWLRPGGLLVLQTQNANGVTAAWMRRRWEQFVPFHLFHFSPRTLTLALAQAGFTRIRIEPSDRFVAPRRSAAGDVPPGVTARRGLRDGVRRFRDSLYVGLGYDRFNIMVATARTPRET